MKNFKFRYFDELNNIYRFFELNNLSENDIKYLTSVPYTHVEQFTGLVDCKLMDIYEGDILLHPDSTDIDWKNGEEDRCTVEYDEQLTRFLLSFESIYGGEGYSGNNENDQLFLYVKKGYYVGGNIKQNLELLQ